MKLVSLFKKSINTLKTKMKKSRTAFFRGVKNIPGRTGHDDVLQTLVQVSAYWLGKFERKLEPVALLRLADPSLGIERCSEEGVEERKGRRKRSC